MKFQSTTVLNFFILHENNTNLLVYDIISVRVLCPLNTDSKYPEVTLQYAKAVLSQECLLKSQFQIFLFRRSVIIMLYLFGFFFFVVVDIL